MDKLLKFLLWVVGIFVVLCLAGRAFVFETWTVPADTWTAAGASPTLRGGDLVLVTTVGSSEFGELVRCPDPDNPGEFVMGRIAGLGGDLVELRGPVLKVNNKTYSASEACTDPKFTVVNPDTGNDVEMACARIEMGSSWHYRGTSLKYSKKGDHRKQVGTNMVYLLSDNREYHEDSRDFGTLDHELCHQKIFFRLWSAAGWTDSENRLTYIR